MFKHTSQSIQARHKTVPKVGAPTQSMKPSRLVKAEKMKPSEVRLLSKAAREKYMLEHAAQAAMEYCERPELIIDGGSELLSY